MNDQPGGMRTTARCICDRGGGKRVGEQAHHRIPGAQCGHVGCGVEDDPGGFGAQAGIGDGAQGDHHVMEVQARRLDLDTDLSGLECGVGIGGDEGQVGQIPGGGGGQFPGRALRRGEQGGGGQPRNVQAAVAQGQLGFAGRAGRDQGQQVVLGGGAVVGVDHADPAGVLVVGGVQ